MSRYYLQIILAIFFASFFSSIVPSYAVDIRNEYLFSPLSLEHLDLLVHEFDSQISTLDFVTTEDEIQAFPPLLGYDNHDIYTASELLYHIQSQRRTVVLTHNDPSHLAVKWQHTTSSL